MISSFDTVREAYVELASRLQSTPALTMSYLERLNSIKETADALHEFRLTSMTSMTDATNTFKSGMPTSITDCEQSVTTYTQTLDIDSATYDFLTVKPNTIQAMIHIHWQYSYLKHIESPITQTSPSDVLIIQPSKVSFVREIIRKLVNNSLNMNYAIKTTKEQFICMQRDLCDNKPIEQILNNFHYDDLCCYGI